MTRKMRWSCVKNGCFRNLCPQLGEFDDCFPGKIGMSDIDGVVEISGRFLFLEWKSPGGALTIGQRIMFERMALLSPRITIILVTGHPGTMEVTSIRIFASGADAKVRDCTLSDLKTRIRAWSDRARESRNG